MAPTRDKWVRRFIIPETTRHKKGFTIYKVTSVVFLKCSHEEISKVSVWKRYNDFKKLHSELNVLYSQSRTKESYPSFPKPKFFGRFEAEVIEERRECALKFLEFIGRHSYLYSSDIFIKFFETSHADYCLNDCSQSLSSDTSAEDDRHTYINSLPNNDIVSQTILQPKSIQSSLINVSIPKNEVNQSQEACESKEQTLQQNDLRYKTENEKISMTKNACNNLLIEDNDPNKIASKLEHNQLICNKNNNCYKDKNYNVKNEKGSTIVQTSNTDINSDTTNENLSSPVITHDGSDLPQSWPDSSQYILIAAAHMSAAFKHEDLTEYEEAFTQYKRGISSLQSGVESDSNKIRAEIIKEKISKYLERAEKLYNRYLNCNISLLNKPVSELQYYKVLQIIESVMLVNDVRQNCLNIVKAIEKLSSNKESISNYILRGQIPYMVRLHACIETETRVFLILQHLSRGKLWDFITSHYNSNNNKNCDKITAKSVTEKTINGNIILRKGDIKNEMEGTKLKENLNLISTNTKVQMEMHPVTVEEKYEKYSDVSTTQLLEKAQILLQSVNATLRESNSVANRLCESDDLINHQDNTSLLNFKNNVYQSKNYNEVSVDINDISLKIDGINKKITNDTIPEKNIITSNYLSQNNITITKSQSSTANSSLSNSYKNLSFEKKESNSSTDSLKTDNTHFATEHKNSSKNDFITKGYELSRSTEICNKTEINNYCISGDQHVQNNTCLMESTKNSNIDTEQELWTIPENVIRLWAAEILLALEALHQQEVIVFDLKPNNILLDDNGHVQLTYIMPRHDIDLLKYKYPYSSPELCTFSPMIALTPATDIWSFGVILYELIVGNKFQVKHPGVFQSHSIINIPSKLSESAKSLLLNILKYEPNERMTIPEIKQHPFFKDTNWSSLVNTL
ncbi:PREDICTED: ribosomal protein S6 kinase delta-1 [Habropoda laboriosa]|uniref:ribosomal protein S6 kinase delta-1 n=1 Tax=Habropoda laboriosa TaxID=597456 RepID=UPI00083D37F5|nr:PREDICTED: ribosomal protein S6 kinase delta-1 [Habropoda laboriosa]